MIGTYEPGTSDSGACAQLRRPASTVLVRFAGSLLLLSLCVAVTGCFGFLKPAQSTTRYFVLTPVSAPETNTTGPGSLTLGVGPVRLPAYLFNTSVAVRKDGNEIEYMPSAIWAERLDTGFERVLAANLAAVLPTEHIYLSAWTRDAVWAEVYVAIEQFDVDANGRGVLVARWRILSPGGEKILKTGNSRLSRQGPSASAEASHVVTTLSELVGDFSQQLAQAIRQTVSRR